MRSTNASHVREMPLDPEIERFRDIFLVVVGREPRFKRAHRRWIRRQQERDHARSQIRKG